LSKSIRRHTIPIEKEEKKEEKASIQPTWLSSFKTSVKKFLKKRPSEEQAISDEKIKREEIIKQLLYDDFKKFEGWYNFEKGIVVQLKFFKHSGDFSLKKDLHGDPNGGFKVIGTRISFEEIKKIIFTGWIYRPTIASPSLGDRLAIEDTDSNGYGFCINHSRNTVWIERRDNGKPSVISQIVNINPLKDKWYYFEFHMMNEGKFNLGILNEMRGFEVSLNSFVDNRYSSFTQVAVHGGFPYYIDEIKVEKIVL